MGGGRTDLGFLGAGIYFAPQLADAARYAPPSDARERRTRLALIAEVAIGNSASFQIRQPQLTAPPRGFDSCRGLGPGGYTTVTRRLRDGYATVTRRYATVT